MLGLGRYELVSRYWCCDAEVSRGVALSNPDSALTSGELVAPFRAAIIGVVHILIGTEVT